MTGDVIGVWDVPTLTGIWTEQGGVEGSKVPEITYVADNFSFDLPVIDKATGAAKDLSGASVHAFARHRSTTITATAEIVDGPGGIIRVAVPRRTLSPGSWDYQVRVTLDGK